NDYYRVFLSNEDGQELEWWGYGIDGSGMIDTTVSWERGGVRVRESVNRPFFQSTAAPRRPLPPLLRLLQGCPRAFSLPPKQRNQSSLCPSVWAILYCCSILFLFLLLPFLLLPHELLHCWRRSSCRSGAARGPPDAQRAPWLPVPS
ncbi:hypothetical protein PFISCL1PPCAC_26078, partial [Pristionchus fissidentatus]